MNQKLKNLFFRTAFNGEPESSAWLGDGAGVVGR